MRGMVPERIAEIRKRCSDAAPGPWWENIGRIYSSGFGSEYLAEFGTYNSHANACFAAHARIDLPDALDALEAEQKAHAETKAALRAVEAAECGHHYDRREWSGCPVCVVLQEASKQRAEAERLTHELTEARQTATKEKHDRMLRKILDRIAEVECDAVRRFADGDQVQDAYGPDPAKVFVVKAAWAQGRVDQNTQTVGMIWWYLLDSGDWLPNRRLVPVAEAAKEAMTNTEPAETLLARIDALRTEVEQLRKALAVCRRALCYPENGHHVCRWCRAETTAGQPHGQGCGYVAQCKIIDEARNAADVAVKSLMEAAGDSLDPWADRHLAGLMGVSLPPEPHLEDFLPKAKDAKTPISGVCSVCGCTENRPCETKHGGCAWANDEHTLCTACAAKGKQKKAAKRKAAKRVRRAT